MQIRTAAFAPLALAFALGAVGFAIGLGAFASTADAAAGCSGSNPYAYRFTNLCREEIFVGQRSKSGENLLPQNGQWAAAASCKSNADCSPGRACDADSGRCTCEQNSECGNAACLADKKCSNWVDFCGPSIWNSGTFWPRTGCSLNASANPQTLSCQTGSCFVTGTQTQLLDCTGAGSPTPPVSLFEVTASSGALNYDVSIASGHNVETYARPIGGAQTTPGLPSSELSQCFAAGCTGDLNTMCPVDLRLTSGGKVIGCLDPCTQCQRTPGNLRCGDALPGNFTNCSSASGPTTYADLYCAKNLGDGNAQASANQGTPTAFGQIDCFPGTTFVQPSYSGGYTMPAGQGVCLYTSQPQASIPAFNDFSWDDAISGKTFCSAALQGQPCGGYLVAQGNGSTGYRNPPVALGYTCRTATYAVPGLGTQTAHLCMPPTTAGLGQCQADVPPPPPTGGPAVPLYSGAGGVTNPSWLSAGLQAGGGAKPYYQSFKEACPGAYAWQYDDASSGFGCNPTLEVDGDSFQGFHVTYCGSTNPAARDGGPPDSVAGLGLNGSAKRRPPRRAPAVMLSGTFTAKHEAPLDKTKLRLVNVLDESGMQGELVRAKNGALTLPLTIEPAGGSQEWSAVYQTPKHVSPNVRIVVQRTGPKRASGSPYQYSIEVRDSSLVYPQGCAAKNKKKKPQKRAELETAFVLDGGDLGSTLVGIRMPWRCLSKNLWWSQPPHSSSR